MRFQWAISCCTERTARGSSACCCFSGCTSGCGAASAAPSLPGPVGQDRVVSALLELSSLCNDGGGSSGWRSVDSTSHSDDCLTAPVATIAKSFVTAASPPPRLAPDPVPLLASGGGGSCASLAVSPPCDCGGGATTLAAPSACESSESSESSEARARARARARSPSPSPDCIDPNASSAGRRCACMRIGAAGGTSGTGAGGGDASMSRGGTPHWLQPCTWLSSRLRCSAFARPAFKRMASASARSKKSNCSRSPPVIGSVRAQCVRETSVQEDGVCLRALQEEQLLQVATRDWLSARPVLQLLCVLQLDAAQQVGHLVGCQA